MSTITVNGQIVVSGSLTIPPTGAWVADLVLAATAPLTSPVTLVVGDLTLTGTIFRSASFAGSKSARIVGGAGGWRLPLPKKGYSHDAGVLASTVLQDAASESGETIVVDSDRQLGTSWTREDGEKAERTLRRITAGQWWIDPAGVTQTKARDASPIATPFVANAWSGGKGQFEVSTEFYADWQPGRTFSGPTILGTQTISTVRYESTNAGKLRLIVLSTASEPDRALGAIRAVVRSELAAVRFAAVWEYTVAASIGLGLVNTVDLVSSDPSMPDLTNVSFAPGVVMSAPLTGTKCRVRFVNTDPARPEVISLGDATEHLMTTEACALLIYNTLSLLMTAAGGGPLLALTLQPLLLSSIVAALAAQAIPAPPGEIAQVLAAPALAATMALGTAPTNTSAPFVANVALLSTKTLDVSGLFPSVGVATAGG